MNRPGFPIAVKLMLGFALAALLPMALLAVFAFRSLEASHEGREQERRKEILSGVKIEIELFIENTQNQVESIASSFDVRKNLSMELDNPYFSQNEFIQRAGFLLSASGFDFLDFIDADGLIRARGQAPDDFNTLFDNIPPLDTLDATRILVRISHRKSASEKLTPSLEIIASVIGTDGELVGIVVCGYYLEQEFFNRLGRPGGEGGVILTDGDFNGLGSSLPNDVETQFFKYISQIQSYQLAYPLREENPDWGKANYKGNILAAESLSEWFDVSTPVYLIVIFPQDEFRSYLADITNSLFLYSILAALLALFVGLILASGISAPIRRLSLRALEFAQTGKFTTFKIQSKDEVEALVRSFSQMADELETNTRRLIQAEKLAAWRDVARKLAHEIKNPLFPIRLNVENLQRLYGKDQKAFDEAFGEATGTIMEEVDILKKLADEFSSFARMPKPLLEQGDINESVRKVMEMFPSDKKVIYEINLADELPEVMFDADQIRMALVNLIKNGAESFDSKGGTVTIATHDVPDKRKILIEIGDDGPGLSESDIDRMFTPYYTTKESGTGLGLAIVENIINDHGGKIWAQSELGEGTTFFISLDAVEG